MADDQVLVIAFDMMAIVFVMRPRLFAPNESGGWAIELETLIMAVGLALCFTGG